VSTPAFIRAGLSPWGDEVPDYRAVENQVTLYAKLSWVYSAVKNVSSVAGGEPFRVKRLIGEKEEQIENHPFELLLRKPNDLHSRFELLMATFAFWQLAGNAYWWLNRANDAAPPDEIWLLPPHRVKPVPDRKLYLKGYLYDPGGGAAEIPLETWEICHFKTFHPKSLFVGMSGIEALAQTAISDMAMQQWNTNYFGRDFAKPSGALAFSGPMSDSDWAALQKKFVEEHGGADRRLMLLRNVGKEGAQWLQFGVSQKDMEFLAGRNFNKEEIYAAFAPGLASVLAINATEANSVAGMATFNKLAVWPAHQAIAEKITNIILPAYGDDLIGEFDDVRMGDRAMDLQEQANAFQLMTVAEARERYYDLPPLGDARDNEIVAGGGAVPPQFPIGPTAQPEWGGALGDETTGIIEEDDPFKTDLDKWRKKAIKSMKAGKGARVNFSSPNIPGTLKASLAGALEAVDNVAAVQRLFESALNWRGYP